MAYLSASYGWNSGYWTSNYSGYRWRYAHPNPLDVLVVIEIADSILKYDQEIKLTLYAEAGISNYWIFNLVENYLEVYSEPYQDLQGKFGYSTKRIILPNQAISLSSFPELLLDLSNVFPEIDSLNFLTDSE